MGLRYTCPHCRARTIPKRIIGLYIGSKDNIKLWECRDCFGIWSDKHD